MTFGARFRAALDARGQLCAGLDPHAALLAAWGLPDTAGGLETFALTATEALAPEVSVLKPQSAFYERFGSAGIGVLERVIRTAREAGALVLLDVKRGDIGSTTQAYADAYLDPASTLCADAITASPYLGVGALDPMFEVAEKHDNGVFLLALTSNPEGPEVQQAVREGRTVAASVLAALAARNGDAEPLGSFGAVIGATLGEVEDDFGINGPLLAPGYGAQGGTPADLARIFGPVRQNVVASSSRGLLQVGPDPKALADAARRANDELRDALA